MKICITAKGDDLASQIETRFGRTPYFIVYDSQTGSFEAIANPYQSAKSGAGIKASQLMIEKEVSVVLTGGVGPNAGDVLKEAHIEIITINEGTVQAAIDGYLENHVSGNLEEAEKVLMEKEITEQKNPGLSWWHRCMDKCFGRRSRRGNVQAEKPSQGGRRGGRASGKGLGCVSGFCACPNCGEKVNHQKGAPCRSLVCPRCQTRLIRE